MTDPEELVPPAPTDPGGTPVTQPVAPLESATREILKGTLVPLKLPREYQTPNALDRYAAVRQLSLASGETDAVVRHLTDIPVSEDVVTVLRNFERSGDPLEAPGLEEVAKLPLDQLARFAQALGTVRRAKAGSRSAKHSLTSEMQMSLVNNAAVAGVYLQTSAQQPIGMLNLERLEMAPAGIERGELIATIPLAPGEKTAVTEKEWSVTSREFTTIVTDALEEVSEVGVTENTDLSQSTSSQNQHSTLFNITGTVQGGLPIFNGSSTTGFTAQDAQSESATSSIKQSSSLTRKASSRSRKEHKTTISTRTVTGTSTSSTRVLQNKSSTDPVRVDYFSLMRKWRVRLYRFGLRLTYDLMIPEPGAAMRRAYRDLAWLRAQMGPFTFPVRRSDITNDDVNDRGEPPAAGESRRPKYLWLADRFGVSVPPYPAAPPPVFANVRGAGARSWSYLDLEFTVPEGAAIREVLISMQVGNNNGNPNLQVMGARYEAKWDRQDANLTRVDEKILASDGTPFMQGATGRQKIVVFLHYSDQPSVSVRVNCDLARATIDKWQSDVWEALHGAAQVAHFNAQQDYANRISLLEDRLEKVDTLTLRREESDEIMKGAIKFLLGPAFDLMPAAALAAYQAESEDLAHGIAFADQSLGSLGAQQWAALRRQQSLVRFVNQAIEWENVVSFLYSYFWDVPQAWNFIREIRHPDANRQAFLRAGSARVVLTVRKGWEQRWLDFVRNGTLAEETPTPATGPYLTIAQEIAAYDDRNYPGIAPANPARTAVRVQEAVYTTSPAKVDPGSNVRITVASSTGLTPGLRVVIDVEDDRHLQEAPLLVEVPDATSIVVDRIVQAHDGSVTPVVVMQPGEKGCFVAEWTEYTPTSGTDIALTSNLAQIA